MTKTSNINWITIERFYRAGIITTKMIAQKCDCTRQAIERRAKAEGWTRNLQSSIRKKVASATQLKSCIDGDAINPGQAINSPEPEKQSAAPPTVSAPVDAADAQARAREDEELIEAAARQQVTVNVVKLPAPASTPIGTDPT